VSHVHQAVNPIARLQNSSSPVVDDAWLVVGT
jgi:hypothetical protein